MKKRHTGFTLIELVVTLAVAAIIVTIAVPSMTLLTKGSRLTAITNEFVTAMQYARVTALTAKQNISVVAVDTTDGNWAQGFTVVDATNKVLRTIPSAGGTVTLIGLAKANTFTFNLAGNLVTPPEVLYVCDSSRTQEVGRQITVTAVGRVRTDSNYTCP